MKVFLSVFCFTLFISNTCLAQGKIPLKGNAKWTNDSLTSDNITISLVQFGHVVETAFTETNGNFSFFDPFNFPDSTYSFSVTYYGMKIHTNKFVCHVASSTEEKYVFYEIFCDPISKEMKDSLRKSWDAKIPTLIYYGEPKYSDQQIFLISEKYGVRYQNLGCCVRSDENADNATAKRELSERLGENWEKQLWAEMKKKHPFH